MVLIFNKMTLSTFKIVYKRDNAWGPRPPKSPGTDTTGLPGSKYARGGFQIFPPFLVYTFSDWLAYLELGHVTFIPLSAHQPGVKL